MFNLSAEEWVIAIFGAGSICLIVNQLKKDVPKMIEKIYEILSIVNMLQKTVEEIKANNQSDRATTVQLVKDVLKIELDVDYMKKTLDSLVNNRAEK